MNDEIGRMLKEVAMVCMEDSIVSFDLTFAICVS